MQATRAKSFQDLILWQRAHQFVLAVYHYTDYFPQKEMFGLTWRFRGAAVSIASNVVEAFKLIGSDDRARFINLAREAIEECRYYLILAKDLGYGDSALLLPQLEEVNQTLEDFASANIDRVD